MWFARNATVTTMSSKPCSASRRMMCSIIGRFATGIIGLGWLLVSGRSRVPSPPARITAFMVAPPSACLGCVRCSGPAPLGCSRGCSVGCFARFTALTQGGARQGDVPGGGQVAEDQATDGEAPGDEFDDVPAGRRVQLVDQDEEREREHQGQRACFADPL